MLTRSTTKQMASHHRKEYVDTESFRLSNKNILTKTETNMYEAWVWAGKYVSSLQNFQWKATTPCLLVVQPPGSCFELERGTGHM